MLRKSSTSRCVLLDCDIGFFVPAPRPYKTTRSPSSVMAGAVGLKSSGHVSGIRVGGGAGGSHPYIFIFLS